MLEEGKTSDVPEALKDTRVESSFLWLEKNRVGHRQTSVFLHRNLNLLLRVLTNKTVNKTNVSIDMIDDRER